MRKIVSAVLCLVLLGCASGSKGGEISTGGTTQTPPVSDAVALSQTVFIGDNITQYWPLTASPASAIVVTGGTAANFAQFANKCVSGCSPNALQVIAQNHKRLVVMVGEFDALDICGGVSDTQFSFNLDALVGAAQQLYGLEVWVLTVPPIYAPTSGVATCTTATATVNQAITAIAAKDNARLIDISGVLASSIEADLEAKYEFSGQSYLPSATGYAAMTTLYNQDNQ